MSTSRSRNGQQQNAQQRSSLLKGKNFKLDAHGIAMADMWLHSSKTRRDLIDSAYNRYTNNDENLPEWFASDEKKHYRPQLPVTKEAVEAYKLRMKEIDARPIKKVAEAKARKKKRAVRRAEKAKKRAEAVIENSDMTEGQKAQEVRKIYKQSMSKQKKSELTYVVAKKGQAGKRVRRPVGVQGRFKVVDPRLKKDNRKMKGAKRSRPNKGFRKQLHTVCKSPGGSSVLPPTAQPCIAR
uniref:Ribosomal RNA methyltransferase SPB1-like C-terminal domain-containing protein n=1 Tax=Romanomermis culicivorax TaxID=13658 RepID=A0A915IM18_ROMCU